MLQRWLGYYELPFTALLMGITVLAAAFLFREIFQEIWVRSIVALGFSSLVFVLYEGIALIETEALRRQYLPLITQLSKWLNVRGDLAFAIDKARSEGFRFPLSVYLSDFSVALQRGMELTVTMDRLADRLQLQVYRDALIQMTQVLVHHGDMVRLVGQLEEEGFSLEKEVMRSKMEMRRELMILLGILLSIPLIALLLIDTQPSIRLFYLDSGWGTWLLAGYFTSYHLGLFLILHLLSDGW
jgi:hypothetical protein